MTSERHNAAPESAAPDNQQPARGADDRKIRTDLAELLQSLQALDAKCEPAPKTEAAQSFENEPFPNCIARPRSHPAETDHDFEPPDYVSVPLLATRRLLAGRLIGFMAGLGASVAVGGAMLMLGGGIVEPKAVSAEATNDTLFVMAASGPSSDRHPAELEPQLPDDPVEPRAGEAKSDSVISNTGNVGALIPPERGMEGGTSRDGQVATTPATDFGPKHAPTLSQPWVKVPEFHTVIHRQPSVQK